MSAGELDRTAPPAPAYDGHRGWLYDVAAGEEWLRGLGARKVQLMVRGTNTQVVGFYDRLGHADQETAAFGRWFDGSR